jgi:hypothetical protein
MKKYIVLSLIFIGGFMLVGVVGAAIAAVQDAANRASTSCNLKFIALSTIKTADDNYGLMPFASLPNPDVSPDRRLSWMVAILPNMTQEPLYQRFDLREPWDSEKNLPAAHTQVRSFICPSASFSSAVACSSLPSALSSSYYTSYVGISGVGQNAAFLPLGDPNCGFFGHERRARFPQDISDGTSQTILLIETSDRNGPWAAGDVPTLRFIDPEVQPLIGRDAPFGILHAPGWYWRKSSYPVHAQVALGDGSVRNLTPAIDPRTLAAAATIAGHDVLGSDW